MKKILTLIICIAIVSFSIKIIAQERKIESKFKTKLANSTKQPGSIAINRNADYTNLSPEELLQKVFLKAGTCTTIDNISVEVYNWNGSSWALGANGAKGLAYFEKSDSDFPMESGLILSTGNVLEAEGSNISDSALGGGIPLKTNKADRDPDLQAIISKQGNYDLTNYTVLEFDFQPTSRYMEFKYIFASEEYPEYVNSIFNDVFGFFLNEVGKTDKINLALLPTTDNIVNGTSIYEVSINNVNNGYFSSYNYSGVGSKPHNSSYFVPNKVGSITTEFDGYTVNMTASYIVDPCKKYHLKIAIGNAGDTALGSGVFLQSNSFQAGYSLTNRVSDEENSAFTYTNDAVNYIRANISDTAVQATTIQLEFGGTAINGVDYTDLDGNPLNDVYIVEAGHNYIDIPYKITNKNVANKTIYLKLFCPCIGSTKYAEMTINVIDPMSDVQLNSTSVCADTEKGSIIVNAIGNSGSYKYSIDNGATWTSNNVISNLPVGEYTVWTKEFANPAIIKKSTKIVNVNSPIAMMQDQDHCNDPNFILDAGILGFGDVGTWAVDSSTPVSGIIIDDAHAPNTNVYVPFGNKIKLNWTVQSTKCTAKTSIVLTSNKSTDTGDKIYKTVNINDCKAQETINLNSLCGMSSSQTNDWECTTKDKPIQINTTAGTISFARDKMQIGTEIFKYSTIDQCGNKIYNFLYINFISQ